jgi:very-short-patch-repair endonuclease
VGSDCGIRRVIHAQSHTQLADRLISELAGRQHGVVARFQLLAASATREQIAVRLKAGRLHELHRGVYLVGSEARPPHAHEAAALLAYHPSAVLSHRSAASIWNLLPYPATAPVWLTIPPERSATRPRIKAMRAALPRRDTRRRHGMPLTSPPRTILDIAALFADPYELERIVAEASFRKLATEAELRDQLERNAGRRGSRRLRAVLDLPGGPHRTRSPAERQLLRLLRERGINGYEVNARVAGFEVDFLWRDARLAVEVDGFDAHSGRIAFERDRLKVAKLRAAGISVMPVTGRRIRDDPHGVAERLLAALKR